MKLICTVAILLVYINYALAGACISKEVDGCIKDMTAVLADGQPMAICRALNNARDCYQRTIEKCPDDPGSKILEKAMTDIDESIKNTCMTHEADDESEEEQKSGECISRARLPPVMSQCTQQIWKESRGNISYGIQPSDIGCNFFLAYARCVSHKISNLCGEYFEETFYYKMIMAWKGLDARASLSSVCADAKKEAEEYFKKNSRKRRSLSNFSFAKVSQTFCRYCI